MQTCLLLKVLSLIALILLHYGVDHVLGDAPLHGLVQHKWWLILIDQFSLSSSREIEALKRSSITTSMSTYQVRKIGASTGFSRFFAPSSSETH